jgi:hypothetical protein
MKDREGKPLRAPMASFAPIWSRMTPEDARAVARFLKALRPVK